MIGIDILVHWPAAAFDSPNCITSYLHSSALAEQMQKLAVLAVQHLHNMHA